MNIVPYRATVSTLILASLFLLGACGKKTPPPPPETTGGPAPTSSRPAPPSPPPVIQLSAEPGTVERGGQATLSWTTENASSVLIDGGVGNVEASGSIVISPRESQTFTATATGPGGEAKASTRVTVVPGDDRGVDIGQEDIRRLQDAIDQGLVKPVFFSYDSAELSQEARSILKENARWFQRYPDVVITIEGHCDERGTEEYNLALGDRRAQAAHAYLVELGVSGERLESLSFGEERPFEEGHNEAAWSQNRRAHFSVRE